MKTGDKVIAKTPLTKCRLLATIVQIEGDLCTIKLPFPIRGEEYAIVSRENLLLIREKKPYKVENKQMKRSAKSIVKRLESIAMVSREEPQKRTQNIPKSRANRNDIQSSNWLDYMEENNIE